MLDIFPLNEDKIKYIYLQSEAESTRKASCPCVFIVSKDLRHARTQLIYIKFYTSHVHIFTSLNICTDHGFCYKSNGGSQLEVNM